MGVGRFTAIVRIVGAAVLARRARVVGKAVPVKADAAHWIPFRVRLNKRSK
jgi:hypothetical protein